MGKQGYGGLEPEALERAAKAVRELNQSPHAQQALQSQIKWAEQKKEAYIATQKKREIELKDKEVETKKKMKDIEIETYKEKQEHADKIERKRQKDMLQHQYDQEEKKQNMIEQKLKNQEEIKRKGIDYEYQKKESLLDKEWALKGREKIRLRKETKEIEKEWIETRETARRQN